MCIAFETVLTLLALHEGTSGHARAYVGGSTLRKFLAGGLRPCLDVSLKSSGDVEYLRAYMVGARGLG